MSSYNSNCFISSLVILLFLRPTTGCYPAVLVSGQPNNCITTDGPLATAQFQGINTFAVDPEQPDTLYVGTYDKLRTINGTSGVVTTVFPKFSNNIDALIIGKRNFGASYTGHTVFEFAKDGTIIKTCGMYGIVGSSIGNCTQTRFNFPTCLLLDPTKTFIIICDSHNNRTVRWNITDDSMSILHTTPTYSASSCSNPHDNTTFFLLTQSYIYLAQYDNSSLQLIAGNSSWGDLWDCTIKNEFLYMTDANDTNKHSTIRKMDTSYPYSVTNYLGYGSSCSLTSTTNYIDAFIGWNGVAWVGSYNLCALYNVYDPIWNTTYTSSPPQPYSTPAPSILPSGALLPKPTPVPSILPSGVLLPKPTPAPSILPSGVLLPKPTPAPSILPSDVLLPNPTPVPSILPNVSLPLGPNVVCQGNYGTIFTCKNGKWFSSTDEALNETNLSHSDFVLSSLFLNGNMLMSDSSIKIENDISIQKQSVLTLQNCSVFVNGNLYLSSQSTIILNTNNNFTLHIEDCAFLDGSLIVNIHQSQTGMRLPIITSSCINGTFSSVFVNLTDSSQCEVIIPHLEYTQGLSMVFQIVNNGCTGKKEVQLWIYIIIGIVVLLLLLASIGSFFVIRRNFEERRKNIDKLDQTVTTQ